MNIRDWCRTKRQLLERIAVLERAVARHEDERTALATKLYQADQKLARLERAIAAALAGQDEGG